MQSGDLPEEAWLVCLASLPHVGPATLHAALAGRSAWAAWKRIGAGQLPDTVSASRRQAVIEAARTIDPRRKWAEQLRSGSQVISPADPRWPLRLDDDPEPPALLFAKGGGLEAGVAAVPTTVAIVGTRACTSYGSEVAAELGREASLRGISVVSGLALGVDAAAHRGAAKAQGAPPIAVLGVGFDQRVPQPNRALLAKVMESGVVYTETPLGAGVSRWRFPARNRIIAALADAVVVVESDERGGSLYTVEEALRRDRPVLAVPGPITSRRSLGTNALLADGATPCRGVGDICDALGVSVHDQRTHKATHLSDQAKSMLDWGPEDRRLLDDIVRESGLAAGRCLLVLEELRRGGWIRFDGAHVCRNAVQFPT